MKIEAKLWPFGSEQGYEEIWPSDLVFDLTWPIFELDRDIIQTNILVKCFMKIKAKLRPLEGKQCFKEIWPSDLVFDRHDPY